MATHRLTLITIFTISYLLSSCKSAYALNRLSVRSATDGTGGEFYDTVTNQPVVLRGNNYQRLINNPSRHHSNFIPGEYDHNRYSAAMTEMKQDGYNAIRVFLSEQDLPVASDQKGISASYIENVLKFVKLANEHNFYVFIQIAVLPWGNSYYLPSIPSSDPHFQSKADYNRLILHGPTVNAKKTFVKEILTALKSQSIALGISLDNILGYSVINEPYFVTTSIAGQLEQPSKPLSLNSGVVTTGNDRQYDMAIPSDKIKMIDENLVYYTNEIRRSIKEVDPQALVGMSLMSPLSGANPGRTIRTATIINDSEADFISIHYYPLGTADSFDTDIASLGITNKSKPLVMGEYGAWKSSYSSALSAANDLKTVQVKSCSQYNFRGWFAYEWDTTGAEYSSTTDLFHHPTDTNIRQALAPIYRSNPCKIERVANPPPTTTLKSNLNIASCTTISGWVSNPQNLTNRYEVHLYADGTGNNHYLGKTMANTVSEEETCKSLGINNLCNYNFSFVTPASLKDGQTHTVDVYVYDGYINPKVIGSGKLLTCSTQTLKMGDLNKDGTVNLFDFNLLVANFGTLYTIFDFNDIVNNYGK